MLSRYNPYVTFCNGIVSQLYTLSLPGGAANADIDLAAVPWPDTQLTDTSASFSTRIFQYNDQPVLRGFGVYCNFADGLVLKNSGYLELNLILKDALSPLTSVGVRMVVDSFNTIIPYNITLPTEPARSLIPSAGWIPVVEMLAIPSPPTYMTKSISSDFDGDDVIFSIRAEFEHTFPMISSS